MIVDYHLDINILYLLIVIINVQCYPKKKRKQIFDKIKIFFFKQTECGLLITDDFKKFNNINWLLFCTGISTSSSVNDGEDIFIFSAAIQRVYPSGPHS